MTIAWNKQDHFQIYITFVIKIWGGLEKSFKGLLRSQLKFKIREDFINFVEECNWFYNHILVSEFPGLKLHETKNEIFCRQNNTYFVWRPLNRN